MTYLIDGVTPLPTNGQTGWGTILNAAINAIDGRFTWSGGQASVSHAAASGITGTTLPVTLVSSSLTTLGTLTSLSVSGTVTIGGDLTVNGTTTTINTATLNVSDNVVVLNNDVTGSPTENAGIEVERGTSTNVLIRWNETSDVWEYTNDGSTYNTIGAASVITGTTLASNVVSSSLTSVGTITSGAWQSSTAVGLAYGGTGKTSAPAAMANLVGFTTTATSGGTTTLTNASSYYQVFTGSATQTVVLPVTSTLQTGWSFYVVNNSSATVTINSSGGNLVTYVPTTTAVLLTCVGTSLTTAADWENGATGFSSYTGTGSSVVLAASPTLTTPTVTTSIATGSTSFALVNTTATTVNFAGAATTLNIGAATGTTTINNALTVSGTTILGPASINGQSSAYTLAISDAGKIVEMTNSTDVAITIPPSGTTNFPVGTQIVVVRNNSGKVSFTPGAGVTLFSDSSKQYISTQYSAATLVKRAADEWYLIGNLSAS